MRYRVWLVYEPKKSNYTATDVEFAKRDMSSPAVNISRGNSSGNRGDKATWYVVNITTHKVHSTWDDLGMAKLACRDLNRQAA